MDMYIDIDTPLSWENKLLTSFLLQLLLMDRPCLFSRTSHLNPCKTWTALLFLLYHSPLQPFLHWDAAKARNSCCIVSLHLFPQERRAQTLGNTIPSLRLTVMKVKMTWYSTSRRTGGSRMGRAPLRRCRTLTLMWRLGWQSSTRQRARLRVILQRRLGVWSRRLLPPSCHTCAQRSFCSLWWSQWFLSWCAHF